MVANRIEVEELAVQCMRQPCQRVPVALIKSRERPLHGGPRQATLNMPVPKNVGPIVEIDKLVPDDGIVKSERGGGQQTTEDDPVFFARRCHVTGGGNLIG